MNSKNNIAAQNFCSSNQKILFRIRVRGTNNISSTCGVWSKLGLEACEICEMCAVGRTKSTGYNLNWEVDFLRILFFYYI